MGILTNAKPKVFIVGAMNGNYFADVAKFNCADHDLKQQGYTTINPCLIDDTDRLQALTLRLQQLLECTAMAIMPDWKDDEDCLLYMSVAAKLSFHIIQIA